MKSLFKILPLFGVLYFVPQASLAANLACHDYSGNWGVFILDQRDCDKIHIVQTNAYRTCTNIPYCNASTEVVTKDVAVLDLKSPGCEAKDDVGNYYCTQFLVEFDGPNIYIRNATPGMLTMADENPHGNCLAKEKGLTLGNAGKTVFSQQSLYQCDDGYVGWSEPKKIIDRK